MTCRRAKSPGARRAPPAPPTRAEYDGAKPFHKGYMAAMFGGRPGSAVPGLDLCPFEAGTQELRDYEAGADRAAKDAHHARRA